MKQDNAMEEAFRNKPCSCCKTKKFWFWRKICHKCYLILFERFKQSI